MVRDRPPVAAGHRRLPEPKPVMSSIPRFFLHRDGRDHGPFSRAELEFLWSEGRASGGDFIRPEQGGRELLLRELAASAHEPPEDELEPWQDDGGADEIPDEQDAGGGGWIEDEPPPVREHRGLTPLRYDGAGPRRDEPGDHADEDPEQALYQSHPSLLVYSPRLFWVLVLATTALWLERFGDFWMIAAAACSGLLLVSVLLERGSVRYRITPYRIESSSGLFSGHSREMMLDDIRSIDVRRSGLAGLFNVGTIEFASAGNDRIEIVFHKVRRPGSVKQLVHDLQHRSGPW